MSAKTLFEKIWERHLVSRRGDGEMLLYVDHNVVHEGPFHAFDRLQRAGRVVRRPAQTFAFADHYVPSRSPHHGGPVFDPGAGRMIVQLETNAARAGIEHFGMAHAQQGIMHVVAPEIGLVQPGMVITGSDSHTTTDGAFGAFAIGIGAAQVEHVLATQTVWYRKPAQMRVHIAGVLGPSVSAKDVALALIAGIGIDGAVGHVVEYTGPSVAALSMEGRMTLCNMSVEFGAQASAIAPDAVTFAYLEGREYAPSGAAWRLARQAWVDLPSDANAVFDREATLDASNVVPMATWGTCQDEAVPLSGKIPDPASFGQADRRSRAKAALAYMDLEPGMNIADIALDHVFIGSCTNARLEDLRAAAEVVRGRRAAVAAMVVPGSRGVQRAAEAEGLDRIFIDAGFEWRQPGCSMCTGANGDRLTPGQRCASTSNRNFEGRQGAGVRTHLVSPASAAAAAIIGRLTDPRILIRGVT